MSNLRPTISPPLGRVASIGDIVWQPGASPEHLEVLPWFKKYIIGLWLQPFPQNLIYMDLDMVLPSQNSGREPGSIAIAIYSLTPEP